MQKAATIVKTQQRTHTRRKFQSRQLPNPLPICRRTHSKRTLRSSIWAGSIKLDIRSIQHFEACRPQTSNALTLTASQPRKVPERLFHLPLTVELILESRALQDGFREEGILRSPKSGQMMHDATSSRALTNRSNLSFISPYKTDVILDPLQHGALIVKARVRQAFLLHGGTSQEPEGADLEGESLS